MKQADKACQNCKNKFVIEPEDFNFYENIKVPPPTFCPDCRLIRRCINMGNRILYKDTCELCGKSIISSYHPDSPYTIYCSPCWWSDKWNPLDYGQEYDFKKTFFEQFQDLTSKVPRQATTLTKSTNCRYCDATINSKNCYLNFGSYFCEDCLYCYTPLFSRTCVDSDFGANMDHAYETYNSDNVHNTKFTWFSEECFDSSFLFDCKGCSNCFGCINLRNKKYYIWNEPYSKKEYEQKMQEWDLGSYEISKKAMKQFLELYYKTPRRFAWMTNAVNVTGDNIKNTKNCHHAFGTLDGVENCKYLLMVGLNIKDSYDLTFAGQTCELLYENIGSIRNQKTFFCNGGADLIECEYCNTCRESRYLFGCICMRNKKHCILNKQYSKEEYSALVPKIKQHLNEMPYQDKRGNEYTYGEFFPDEISPWTYNESYAYQWFPLTKEEALQKGYRWRDREKQNYNTTLEANDLPNHIKDVPDTITKEIIECADKAKCNHNCTEAFKIIPEELNFYRHSNVALPRLCPNCRYGKRIELRTQPKLWRRKCENEECENEFETAYSPERKEIIWCQECYNNKFV